MCVCIVNYLEIFHDFALAIPRRTRLFGETRTKLSRFYIITRSTFIYFLSLQNAVGKMRPLALVLAGCFNLLQVVVYCQELSVIRHSDGDIFTIEGKYTAYMYAYIYILSRRGAVIVIIVIVLTDLCERTNNTFEKSRTREFAAIRNDD